MTLLYIHTYIFFFYILFHYGLSQGIECSSLCYRVGPCCSFILFVESYVCSPQPPTISLPQTLPPWQTSVCSLCSWFCFIDEFICITFQIPYINNVIWYLSFSYRITSFSMITSSCTHVAANGVILFFLWLSSTALWRRQWHPTPVLLPGKSQGWGSLVGCSPWGR